MIVNTVFIEIVDDILRKSSTVEGEGSSAIALIVLPSFGFTRRSPCLRSVPSSLTNNSLLAKKRQRRNIRIIYRISEGYHEIQFDLYIELFSS